jgi:hypothetical protein
MRVSEAVTSSSEAFVWGMLSVLIVVYAAIAVIAIALLLKLTGRWRREDATEAPTAPEEGAPYGPRSEIPSDGGPGPLRQGVSGSIQTLAITTVLAVLGFGILILLVIAISLVGLGVVARRSIRVITRRSSS